MKYIVSGYRRSGTSMMMNALYKGMPSGGLLYSLDMERLNPEVNGWMANPGGLWEVGSRRYLEADFLRGMPDGSLVKIFFDGLVNLPHDDYKIIFMNRDVEEIKMSMDSVDNHISRPDVSRKVELLTFSAFKPYSQDDIDHVLGIMDARKDVELIEIDYAEVLENPEKAFRKIIGHH